MKAGTSRPGNSVGIILAGRNTQSILANAVGVDRMVQAAGRGPSHSPAGKEREQLLDLS